MIDCRFAFGIDIEKQTWPDDPRYLHVDKWPLRLAWADEQVRRWSDPKERGLAIAMLEIYSGSGMREQQSVFIRRDNLKNTPKAVRDAVWALIEGAPA